MLHIIKRRLAVSRYEKEVPFFKERYMKGYLFCQKWYVKGCRAGPWCGASLYKTILTAPNWDCVQ